MTNKQQRHFERKAQQLLKRELRNYQRFRELGIRLYPDPARLPR